MYIFILLFIIYNIYVYIHIYTFANTHAGCVALTMNGSPFNTLRRNKTTSLKAQEVSSSSSSSTSCALSFRNVVQCVCQPPFYTEMDPVY